MLFPYFEKKHFFRCDYRNQKGLKYALHTDICLHLSYKRYAYTSCGTLDNRNFYKIVGKSFCLR